MKGNMAYIIEATSRSKDFSNYEGEYVLYTMVRRNLGDYEKNFVCTGDLEYCEKIKQSLANRELYGGW